MTPPSPQPTESKTPLTDTEVESVSHRFQNLYPHLRDKAVRADFARSLELRLNEANDALKTVRELREIEGQHNIAVSLEITQLKVDNTQLRKVCDLTMKRAFHQKTCACLQNGKPINPLICNCGYHEASEGYNSLTHVIAEKKGKENRNPINHDDDIDESSDAATGCGDK